MKHPVYLAIATAACAYLVLADARGWNPFTMPRFLRSGPGGSGGSGLYHK